jgi:WD repeat and SOF domain-containing protein 1
MPKPIHQATKLKREMLDARRTKEQNRIAHAPKGVDQELLKPAPAKKSAISKVEQ